MHFVIVHPKFLNFEAINHVCIYRIRDIHYKAEPFLFFYFLLKDLLISFRLKQYFSNHPQHLDHQLTKFLLSSQESFLYLIYQKIQTHFPQIVFQKIFQTFPDYFHQTTYLCKID